MSAARKRFRVAFSFAGEKRDFVAKVAAVLAARFDEAAVLYDKYHEAEFARRDLGFYLPDLYHRESDLVVVVVCRDYAAKEWCGLEWDAIFDLLKKRKSEEVMLCRFDHATVRGLFSTAGFVELDDKSPDEAATRILERLALNEGKAKGHYLSNGRQEGFSPTPGADFTAGPSRLLLSRSHIPPTHMFSELIAARFEKADLLALGNAMISEESEPIPERTTPVIDAEENSGISAGYTYLGQFIYHDLTFSEGSSVGRHGFVRHGTERPAFDLSCIYGKGPANQPYLYSPDGLRMALGGAVTGAGRDPNACQVKRDKAEAGGSKRALIADPRNDENFILSQLHAAMLRFHNRVADILRTDSLEEIQQLVRFHYQWVVLYDFLPTIIGRETLRSILPHMTTHSTVLDEPPRLRFYKANSDLGIPVEFSAAAYRFGHSMIRPTYRLNREAEPLPVFAYPRGRESLSGFRNIPSNLGIDWGLFFQMSEDSPKSGPERVQLSYKIDTSLLNLLGHLPSSPEMDLPSLAARNLLRGVEMKLPSGQAVAGMMGFPPIADDDLRVGSATEAAWVHNKPIVELSPRFRNNAPLWFYILAEAQQQFRDDSTPIRLGPVGGRIVGEVLIGLLYRDKYSFLNVNPSFQPLPEMCSGRHFSMADLLRQAMQA